MSSDPRVRRATGADAEAVARLLYRFNTEFDEYVPAVPVLTERISAHLRFTVRRPPA
jgi:hypothetical protein